MHYLFICLFFISIFPLNSVQSSKQLTSLAEQWSKPINLSIAGQNASSPQVAIDNFGNAVAVWHRFNGQCLVIQASVKSLGGAWQSVPTDLSSPECNACNPQIAIDAFGNVTVVWEQFSENHSTIQAIQKPLGGKWQAIPDRLSLSGYNATNPHITSDSFGNLTAVWQCLIGNVSLIQASTKSLGGNWQESPSNISSSSFDSKNPQVVVDIYDTVIVVWQASKEAKEVIQSSMKFFQEDWQNPDTICSPSLNNSHPQIVVDDFGNATVVWNRYDGMCGTIEASTKLYGRNWQNISDTLSLSGRNSFSPQIAVNSFGDVTAVWESFNEKKIKSIQASTKEIGKNWQAIPDQLSPPGDHHTSPRIAIDPIGNISVVWNNYQGHTRIYLSKKSFSGKWQLNPEILSEPGRSAFFPQIAIDPLGNAIVIWVIQDSLSLIQISKSSGTCK